MWHRLTALEEAAMTGSCNRFGLAIATEATKRELSSIPEQGTEEYHCISAFAPFLRKVDIGKIQPECELVKPQGGARAVQDCGAPTGPEGLRLLF
jgi:hypothetical protein